MTDREERQARKKDRIEGIISEAQNLLETIRPIECLTLTIVMNMGGVTGGKIRVGVSGPEMFNCPILVSPEAHGIKNLITCEIERAKKMSPAYSGKVNITLAWESPNVFAYSSGFDFDIMLKRNSNLK